MIIYLRVFEINYALAITKHCPEG